jgi:hypothetical protein
MLNIEVSQVRTALGSTAIVINDTATHVQTLVDITPAMADQVEELFKNVPGLLGRIQEDLKAFRPVFSRFLTTANIAAEDRFIIAPTRKCGDAFPIREGSRQTNEPRLLDREQKTEHTAFSLDLYRLGRLRVCPLYIS